MKNKFYSIFFFGITLLTGSFCSGVNVYLENNYGAMINCVTTSAQPNGQNIGNNVRVLLGDINYIATLSIRTVGFLSYGTAASLSPYLIEIRNQQARHANDDAVIAIGSSGYTSSWNISLRWETKGKIKPFETSEFPAIVGTPKVQPNPSQPLTQPAVTMDIDQLSKELALMEATTADARLAHIKNGALGSDYARKATEICNANYDQAKKLGKIDLCARLKTELLAPQYGIAMKKIKEQMAEARQRGKRVVEVRPDLAPALDDMKNSITRMHNSLAGYKSRGEAY